MKRLIPLLLLLITTAACADSTGSSTPSRSTVTVTSTRHSSTTATSTSMTPIVTTPTQVQASGPSIGDACIGADIGKRATDPNGVAIICDSDYTWQIDHGQTPNDPWAAAQSLPPTTETPTTDTPTTTDQPQCTDGDVENEGGGNYSTCENGQWNYVQPTFDPNSGDGYGPDQPLPPLCVRFPDEYTC